LAKNTAFDTLLLYLYYNSVFYFYFFIAAFLLYFSVCQCICVCVLLLPTWRNKDIHCGKITGFTAFDEGHGFCDFRVSVIFYCP